VVRAVNQGAQSGPGRAVTVATGNAGTAGRRSKVSTGKGQQIGLGSRAKSASVAAAFPSVECASAVGGRPVRMRQTPSALNDFEHQAGVKITIPAGKMCDTCKVKPAAYPDKNDWNCAECQFKE
jgi:hypothetical protein